MFERRSTGISLEADGTVRVAELTASPRTLALSRVATYEPEGSEPRASWEAGISQAAEDGYEMSRVVIGLPGTLVYRKSLTFPFRNRNRIMQILQSELEGEIPLPPGTFVADYLDGPARDDGMSITVLAVENDIISRLHDSLKEGIGVRAVQTVGVGIVAAASRSGIEEGVVLWCSEREAVVVEMRSSLPAGVRRYQLSGSDETDTTILLDAVQLVTRVDDKVLLLGAGPVDQLVPLLNAPLQGPAQQSVAQQNTQGSLRISRSLELGMATEPAVLSENQNDYLATVGFALRAAGVKGGVPFDLRQGSFLESQPLHEIKGPAIRTAIIAALVLFLGIGSLALGFGRARDEYNGYARKLEQEFKELFPDTRVVNEIAQATEKLEILKKRTEALAGLSGGSALEALSHLSSSVPEDVALRLDELSFDSRKLRLEGSVSSFDAVDKIKSSLEADPMFAEVQVQNARVGADVNKVTFRLVMEVN
jgi:general secretion pathway protein L